MFRITELRAVNDILAAAGEAPITTLAGLNPLSEAQAIRNEIEMANYEIQESGWAWNTNPRYQLLQDVNGKVPIPSNVLQIQQVYEANITYRGDYLWDTENNTDVLNTDVYVAAILLLPFDELPFVAQKAVYTRAGRKYLTRFDAANDERYSLLEESNAMDELVQNDIDTSGFGYSYNSIMRDIAFRTPSRYRPLS